MAKIYHIVKGELKEENTSKFYKGDVYVVDQALTREEARGTGVTQSMIYME